MSLAAGRLRHRVALQQPVRTQDPQTGEVTVGWWTAAEVWAAIEPMSVREFLAAAQAQSKVTTRITIRRRADIGPTWRIVHRSDLYNIEGILPDKESGLEYMTLACHAGTDDGE